MKERKSQHKILPLFFFLVVVIFASSCIPNERIVYLQNRDLLPELANDTLIALKRTDYKLQPNDILLINFYSREQQAVEKFYPIFVRMNLGNNGNGGGNNNGIGDPYITGYNVDKDGNIEINALGRIKASGLTTEELKYEIENKIREQEGINDILVGVKLQGIKYTIFGEVGGAGTKVERVYELNIIQAIANSGDLSINANRRKVLLLRDYPDGVRIHEIDVTSRSTIPTEYWFIQPDDIIYVPPLKIREIGVGTNALQNLSVIISVISSTTLIISLLTRF